MKNEPIILEKLFDSSISKVWKAITDKDEMKVWYFDLKEFKPEVGFKFQFTGGPDDGKQYLHLCEVTEVIDKEKLTYSWKYDGYTGISYVTFELFEREEKTLLRLTHKGLDSLPKDNPDFDKSNFDEGWAYFINTSLKDFLEK